MEIQTQSLLVPDSPLGVSVNVVEVPFGLDNRFAANDAVHQTSMALNPVGDWEDVHLPYDSHLNTTGFSSFSSLSRPRSLKRVPGLQNCTSVVAVWDGGSFATHQHLARLRGDSRLQFAKALRSDLAKVKVLGGESTEVFIAGGNYYSNEYAVDCGERLIVEVEEMFRVGRISEDQRDQIVRVINDGIRVIPYLSEQEGDRCENYREFVAFLQAEIAEAVGHVNPIVLGPNGVPAAVHVVADSVQRQIVVVKPKQPNPAMNGVFRADQTQALSKSWSAVG